MRLTHRTRLHTKALSASLRQISWPVERFLRVRRGLLSLALSQTNRPAGGWRQNHPSYDFRSQEQPRRLRPMVRFRFGNGRPHELALTIQAADWPSRHVLRGQRQHGEPPLHSTARTVFVFGRRARRSRAAIANATIEAASPSSDSRTLFEMAHEHRRRKDASPGTPLPPPRTTRSTPRLRVSAANHAARRPH